MKDIISYSTFNHFEVLDSMVLEEGIPPSVSFDPICLDEGFSPNVACGASQIVVYQNCEVPVAPMLDAFVTLVVSEDNDVALADLVKDVIASSKGKGPLGVDA